MSPSSVPEFFQQEHHTMVTQPNVWSVCDTRFLHYTQVWHAHHWQKVISRDQHLQEEEGSFKHNVLNPRSWKLSYKYRLALHLKWPCSLLKAIKELRNLIFKNQSMAHILNLDRLLADSYFSRIFYTKAVLHARHIFSHQYTRGSGPLVSVNTPRMI